MKQYLDALKHIMENGVDRQNRTGISTRAVFGVQMRFKMKDGFPAVTTKKLAFNSMKAELLWFIKGISDVKELQKMGCHIWDANAEAPYWKSKARFPGDLGRVYGVQWRHWKTPEGKEVESEYYHRYRKAINNMNFKQMKKIEKELIYKYSLN